MRQKTTQKTVEWVLQLQSSKRQSAVVGRHYCMLEWLGRHTSSTAFTPEPGVSFLAALHTRENYPFR